MRTGTDGQADGRPHGPVEVWCVGEALAVLTPADGGPLATAETLRLSVGGAEASVARCLSGLGHRCSWASRVGDDPFGHRIRAELAAQGVDVSHVRLDPAAPTGVYFKDRSTAGTVVRYYRAGSAAAGMCPADLDALPLAGARLVHLSGVTPALSAQCADMVAELFDRAAAVGALVSFDVNYRPALWPPDVAGPALRELARRADVTLVGLDEAHTLWGADSAEATRATLAGDGVLVVKDGPVGATEFDGQCRTFQPAPSVQVVEPVGAGDAFAAGYLAGLLRGWPPGRRLRLGHRLAGMVLGSVDDHVPVPPGLLAQLLSDTDDPTPADRPGPVPRPKERA